MQRWQRIKYQPNLPLYTCKERVTGGKKHIELSRQAEICESSYLPTGLALPRKQEIFACFNRYRGIRL